MLLLGYIWFSIWSLVAGLAVYSNHVLFVFARVLQGIGPAICMPNGLAVLGIAYAPSKRKNLVFAIFGACAPTGAAIGAVFSALFALAWWPWAYFAIAIALIATAIIGEFIIPDIPRKHFANLSLRDTICELDILGAAVGIAALVLFNFAWN